MDCKQCAMSDDCAMGAITCSKKTKPSWFSRFLSYLGGGLSYLLTGAIYGYHYSCPCCEALFEGKLNRCPICQRPTAKAGGLVTTEG